MSFVITIGRQYGSGGRFIGKKLAELLGVNFYDNELITTAATQSGLSKAVLDNYDEKKDGFFTGVVPSSFGADMSLSQKVFLAQFEAIKAIADRESCVIVGRCADYVLRENPNVVNIYITAPIEARVERAVKYYNLDTKKAKETILKMDKKRASYYNFYSDKKWGRAESYNLTIDSSVGIDAACEIIKFYVEKKLNIKL